MSYQRMHNKLADKHAELARDFQGFGQRTDSQTARLNSIDVNVQAAEAAAKRALSLLDVAATRIASLESELATMRLALCEIRKAQHDRLNMTTKQRQRLMARIANGWEASREIEERRRMYRRIYYERRDEPGKMRRKAGGK